MNVYRDASLLKRYDGHARKQAACPHSPGATISIEIKMAEMLQLHFPVYRRYFQKIYSYIQLLLLKRAIHEAWAAAAAWSVARFFAVKRIYLRGIPIKLFPNCRYIRHAIIYFFNKKRVRVLLMALFFFPARLFSNHSS